MNSPAAAAVPGRHDPHSVAFNLGAIAIVVALAGIGLAYAINAASRAQHGVETRLVTRMLGATELTIPTAWLDEETPAADGFAKQVNLKLTLPLGPDAAPRHIGVTLLPRSRARPSAMLLDGVYLHQFMPEQLNGPPGLIGKPLMAQNGFENETVWYDALSPTPFVAKCLAPAADGHAGQCLRTVYLGPGIAAVYVFDDDVLGNWRRFDAALHPLLKRLGAL